MNTEHPMRSLVAEKARRDRATRIILAITGLAMLVCGVAQIHGPSAWIVAGAILYLDATLKREPKHGPL
jgi:hypothetical protein